MGLQNTAHYLKSKGRGTDTELVHMSKRELKGLQDLAMAHGGSLTINPDTGLAEAGFLEQVLPVVAAAAATYFTAGAAAPALAAATGMGATASGILAGAGAGALISGGAAAMQGKNVGQAALMGGLGGAISGGMGAYSEAPNLLADASQKAVTEGATETAKGAVTEGAKDVAAQGTGLSYDPGAGYGTGVPTGGAPTPAQTSAFMQGDPGQLTANQLSSVQPEPTIYSGLGTMGKAAVQALPVATMLEQKQPQQLGPQEQPSKMVGLSPNFKPYTPTQPNPYYKARYPSYAGGGPVEQMTQNMMGGQGNMYPQSQQEHTNFATPTQMPASAEVIRSDYDAKTDPYTGVMMAAGGLPPKEEYLPKGDPGKFSDTDPATKGLSALDAANYRNKKLMAKSGIKMAEMPKTGIKSLGGDFSDVGAAGGTLGSYSDGGRMLKGPGDGMSDSIPAQIGRKQPARLADGEFVVPADVVSHLGNGSTDAGAKRLYTMMDKVRRARTGKKKQAPAVKAERFMPA